MKTQAEILFSWDLIAALNSVWAAHRCAVPMFNEDNYTEHEIVTIATKEDALLIHGGKRVLNEWREVCAYVGQDAAVKRLVDCRVVG